MARRERSSSHDNKIEKPKEGQFGSISDVQKNRTGSGGWRIGSVGKAAGKAIQKINLGRMIDQMEECQELADALEAVNAETQDEINFREIKREAEVACMLEVRKHLEVFVVEHPEATYEQWIMELHPDNINEKVPQTIDHRFYVEDSDHRRLWNINLTRGGGKRSYVHALSGDDLPIYNQQKKQPSFVNRRNKDKQPKDTHEADLDQYAPQHHLHDDEDELDVDVSDPMGSLDISMSFTYDPKKNKDPRFEEQLEELRRRRSSAGSVSNDSLGLDYDGSHLFSQPSSSRNANHEDNNNNKDRSLSPKSQTNSNNDAAEPLDNIPPSSSRQNKHNDIHEPDPYKDLGFDRDDEDDDALENKPQPQLNSEPRNTSRRRSSNSSYRDDDDDTDDHDHLQPDPYKDLGFIPDDEEEEEDELEEPSPIHEEQLQSKRNSESRSSGSRNSYRGEDHQPDPYQDLGFDRDVEEDLDDEPNLFPPSIPVVTDKSPSPSFTPAAQDDVTAPQPQTATTTAPEKQTKNPTTTSSSKGEGGAPRFDTIETRLHLENYITQNPQCEYEHWIGEYYPHLVSRNLTTGDVLILGEEDAFYDERSEFRRLWNIYLAKGGGRRTYVSARRY